MKRPIFSCVMPVKGPRPYMEEALASLSAQGMGDDLEVIVQDGTLECANNTKIPQGLNVRWYHEEDDGQSDAMNKGFAKAQGEWLFWLNADDVLLPGALKKAADRINRIDKIEWIAGNHLQIDEDGRVVGCSVGPGWHDFLFRHTVPHVYGPSSFFRRELLDRVGGLDAALHVCMDWDLWIRFMQSGAKFSRIDDYLWTLRQWQGSKTKRQHEADEARRQWDEVTRMLAKNGFKVTSAGLLMLRLWRTLNGNYIRQLLDRRRLCGRKAAECAS